MRILCEILMLVYGYLRGEILTNEIRLFSLPVLYLVNVKPHHSKLRIVAWLVDLCYITYFAFPQTTIFQNTKKKQKKQKTCKHNNNSRFVVALFID